MVYGPRTRASDHRGERAIWPPCVWPERTSCAPAPAQSSNSDGRCASMMRGSSGAAARKARAGWTPRPPGEVRVRAADGGVGAGGRRRELRSLDAADGGHAGGAEQCGGAPLQEDAARFGPPDAPHRREYQGDGDRERFEGEERLDHEGAQRSAEMETIARGGGERDEEDRESELVEAEKGGAALLQAGEAAQRGTDR